MREVVQALQTCQLRQKGIQTDSFSLCALGSTGTMMLHFEFAVLNIRPYLLYLQQRVYCKKKSGFITLACPETEKGTVEVRFTWWS